MQLRPFKRVAKEKCVTHHNGSVFCVAFQIMSFATLNTHIRIILAAKSFCPWENVMKLHAGGKTGWSLKYTHEHYQFVNQLT